MATASLPPWSLHPVPHQVHGCTDIVPEARWSRLARMLGDPTTKPSEPHLAPAVVAVQKVRLEPPTHPA